MFHILIVVGLIAAVLLVLIVLAQNPKGGISSQFGGGGVPNVLGAKKTGDFLENSTWILALVVFVVCIGATKISQSDSAVEKIDANIEKAVSGEENGDNDLDEEFEINNEDSGEENFDLDEEGDK